MLTTQFQAGDLVSRDGNDAWRITAVRAHDVECICEVPPPGWLRQDGSHGKAWCKAGDTARFLIIELSPAKVTSIRSAPPSETQSPSI